MYIQNASFTKKIIVPPDETQEMFHEMQVHRHTYTIHLMVVEQRHNLDRLGTVLDAANISNYLHKKKLELMPDSHQHTYCVNHATVSLT